MNNEVPMKMSAIRAQLGVGVSYFAAMKSRMGLAGARLGLMSRFTKFVSDNPGFRLTDVYHLRGCECPACRSKRLKPASGRGRPRRTIVVTSAS